MVDVGVVPAKPKGIVIHSDVHRLLIGLLGLLLPIILVVAVMIRSTPGEPTFLDSLSAYYYSSGLGFLEGTLAGLVLFLAVYQGYPGKYQWLDKLAARLAATAAFFIAVCPTYPPTNMAAPPWWTTTSGKIHDVASAVMFVMFAVFSLWLFRLTDQRKEDQPRDKQLRDHFYLASGVTIIVSCLVVVYRFRTGNLNVLVPESVAIWAFASAFLVKGGVLQLVASWLKRL